MTELSQSLTTDYRTPQGDYQRIQYIPVSQAAGNLPQAQHIQLQVVQVAPVGGFPLFYKPSYDVFWRKWLHNHNQSSKLNHKPGSVLHRRHPHIPSTRL